MARSASKVGGEDMRDAVQRREVVHSKAIKVRLPSFFPSISSVKANFRPVEYLRALLALHHKTFLVSAYDIATSCEEDAAEIRCLLERASTEGAVILMDSGNYERYWHKDDTWVSGRFHEVLGGYAHHFAFCYDNQSPTGPAKAIADDVIDRVVEDQQHTGRGLVLPIVHGAKHELPVAVGLVAQSLAPQMIAVAERDLGDGLLQRMRTTRRIREAIDATGSQCALHLLGTGNPVSIAALALAGADSFDGLEWLQTAVDPVSVRLLHFQQSELIWDLAGSGVSYAAATLAHNLEFYAQWMCQLQSAIVAGALPALLGNFVSEDAYKRMVATLPEVFMGDNL